MFIYINKLIFSIINIVISVGHLLKVINVVMVVNPFTPMVQEDGVLKMVIGVV